VIYLFGLELCPVLLCYYQIDLLADRRLWFYLVVEKDVWLVVLSSIEMNVPISQIGTRLSVCVFLIFCPITLWGFFDFFLISAVITRDLKFLLIMMLIIPRSQRQTGMDQVWCTLRWPFYRTFYFASSEQKINPLG
jgi:hypothetical protein